MTVLTKITGWWRVWLTTAVLIAAFHAYGAYLEIDSLPIEAQRLGTVSECGWENADLPMGDLRKKQAYAMGSASGALEACINSRTSFESWKSGTIKEIALRNARASFNWIIFLLAIGLLLAWVNRGFRPKGSL